MVKFRERKTNYAFDENVYRNYKVIWNLIIKFITKLIFKYKNSFKNVKTSYFIWSKLGEYFITVNNFAFWKSNNIDTSINICNA